MVGAVKETPACCCAATEGLLPRYQAGQQQRGVQAAATVDVAPTRPPDELQGACKQKASARRAWQCAQRMLGRMP
jgi:hypothetical protein